MVAELVEGAEPQVSEGFTLEDLRVLLRPGARIELVDGSIVMAPTPGVRHEVVAELLRRTLAPQLPGDLMCIGPIGVALGETVPEPDIVVFQPADVDRPRLVPDEVHIAIEIVSPGSRTNDRITKPALYAEAGIGHYWRVETSPHVSITVYVLQEGDSAYAELGTWGPGETLSLAEPFDLEIAIDDLSRG